MHLPHLPHLPHFKVELGDGTTFEVASVASAAHYIGELVVELIKSGNAEIAVKIQKEEKQ